MKRMPDTLPRSPEAEALLASASQIARAGGRSAIGVDHILLALLRNPEIAAGSLQDTGISLDTYCDRLAALAHAGAERHPVP
jgi:ATP-dependent Clp protease ATP-binding subunit ClpA